MVRTVVTLAPGVDNVDVHEGRAVASLHHLVADLLQQHQGQQASHHQGLEEKNGRIGKESDMNIEHKSCNPKTMPLDSTATILLFILCIFIYLSNLKSDLKMRFCGINSVNCFSSLSNMLLQENHQI